MHPVSLNMLLFLKANRYRWPNPSIIQKILNERKVADFDDEDHEDDEELDDNRVTAKALVFSILVYVL